METCGGPREEPLIRVGADQAVESAVVYLVDVAKGKAWPEQGKPPELDNVKCRSNLKFRSFRQVGWTSSTATRCSTTRTAITASGRRSTWPCRMRDSESPSS